MYEPSIKKYAVNLLPLSAVNAAFKNIFGRKPTLEDLSTLKIDLEGENLIIIVPENIDLRKGPNFIRKNKPKATVK